MKRNKIISIILSIALVICMVPAVAFGDDSVSTQKLEFYSADGYEYSMLGNSFNEENPLKADVNESYQELMGKYAYLSACTTMPEGTSLSDMSVKWYYSNKYDAKGQGYKEVDIPKASKGEASKEGEIGNIHFSNKAITSYGQYYNLMLVPDTTMEGTYYYYAVVSDGKNTITNREQQAVVKVSPKEEQPPAEGNIKAGFSLKGLKEGFGFEEVSMEIKAGSNAFDFLKTVFEEKGYKYEDDGTGYITAVITDKGDRLAAFDKGQYSGWMYSINGKAPEVGMGSYILKEGDKVLFYYVEDYTKDSNEELINEVKNTKITAKSAVTKKGIKISWKKEGSTVSRYQVYRKEGKKGSYKKIYTTKKPTTLKIVNVKNLKKGKTYYYKVRGIKVIDGKTYYTKWSNYTYRKVR